jgi:hypothetical protein
MRWASVAEGSALVVTADVALAQTLERCALTLSRGARHFIGVVFDERPPIIGRGRRLRRLIGGSGRPAPAATVRARVPLPAPEPSVEQPTKQAAQSAGRS